ncbi:MAG: IS200/IS605 family transposase [Bacteroidales bacterium]|nr:IS200/IS605 family transposase [Bacteroidales bacterium]
MPNSYHKCLAHLVFAVKNRYAIIQPHFAPYLHSYIGGIIDGLGGHPIIVNGVHDHVHLLFGFKPSMSLSDMARDIKSNSTNWINDNRYTPCHFQWQEGCGYFTVSKSQVDKVEKYISEQAIHHQQKAFLEEYRRLLELHEIEFEDEYIFTEIEG